VVGDSGASIGAVEGLRGRLPDWAGETAAELDRKMLIRKKIKSRETAALCDIGSICEKYQRIVAPARGIQSLDLLHCGKCRFNIK